ncbi:orc1/cdc6 family replication initiation protein (plasmid) [Haloterrigena turkmenica DSM 5511]|uniref:ORC1-type DNA replication protein n=1 Tax=Haloterrigena turkmenica (strain ATCC 51198 / DSM 5511 / JCM 9101 / NCIMB 13204 / VKM B-1734 / 4k) TaxID=543526 RepID=D2S2E8_HALTV|nr:orc1/cdc6 family replication initiation protein [Haloterrigena turkmenica]ADB63545.1 orc1/cdc6 family replication initiation protein [Haloterrigena turkmenica DSM 5511]
MADGNDQQSLSQSIKGRLQEGVQNSVFREKALLDPDTVIDEDRIVGRDQQLDDIITYLRPILQSNRPPNMLLYGPSGTGKSLIINAVCEQVSDLATAQDIQFGVVQINCQTIKSHDRAVYRLVENAAAEAGVAAEIPESGISTDQKLRRFYELLSEYFDSVIIILDEVDLLVGRQRDPNDEPAYSKLLYQLSRASQLGRIEGDISVAALTNDPRFMENLDGRAESSFNPQDVVFPDYDANQLQAILDRRRDAYRDDVLEDGIIPLSSAFAAQDHGDARKAIDLFRKAGELADRQGEETVREEHVRDAQKEAERDRTLTQMQGLSTQKKLSLYATAIVPVYSNRNLNAVPSTVAFRLYQYIAELLDADQKSRDSYLRYMTEAETYNFVTSEKRGRGYGSGVHKEYTFVDDPSVVAETLQEDIRLEEIENNEELIESVVNAQINDFFEGN